MNASNIPGLYVLTHLPTGHFYVGSSKTLRNRVLGHRGHVCRGTHPNKLVKEHFLNWDDVKVELFVVETLEEARELEQKYLDAHHGSELCCNIGNGSTSLWLPGTTPEEYREINRIKGIGNTYAKGHVVSEEVREAVRKANTGLKRSDATRAKMRASWASPDRKPIVGKKKPALWKRVSIEGVIYENAAIAAESLGLKANCVKWRIYDSGANWKEWKFAD